MFEKIVLRRSETGQALTLGEIAEALLFYEKVHLVLDQGSLTSLIQSLGTQELIALLARKRFSTFYSEDMLVCQTRTVGVMPRHSFGAATISSNKGEKIRKSRKERLELTLEKSGLSRGEARKLTDHLSKYIQIQTLTSDYFVPGGIPKAATEDLSDSNYVSAALARVLRDKPGFESSADNLKVEVIHLGGEFVIQTNIDFAAGNARRAAIDKSLGPVTEAELLVPLVDARADLDIASHYGCDFRTSAATSDIVRIRHSELLKRSGISAGEIANFKDVVLNGYPTVREVINGGERSFKEFERLLDHAEKFRNLVHGMDSDAKLVEEYISEITREGDWISTLPVKILRYTICLCIGLRDPLWGAGLSAADALVVDKIFKGWRANHFVDGKLKPFLGS